MKKSIKLGIYTVIIIALIILSYFLYQYRAMNYFMGGVFIIISILKMLDWKGFIHAFSMYDVIAKRSKTYAYIYPAIEFCLGFAFLLSFQVKITAAVTFLIMAVGSVGVAQNLLSPKKVRCACVGTLIKVPLTEFTLVEDIYMAVMAVIMFFL